MNQLIPILRAILKNEPGFNPSNSYERNAVENLISLGLVNPKRSETSDEFIALVVTKKGKSFLSALD